MRLGPEDFAGRWRIVRRIEDRRAGQPGRFEGTAEFSRAEGSAAETALDYAETGLLTLGAAAPLAATRRYLWVFRGQDVDVRFGDGRPFHRFTLAPEAPGTDHPCGADLYRVHYRFGDWPVWRATWEVSGPRKDYRMTTTYGPADGA